MEVCARCGGVAVAVDAVAEARERGDLVAVRALRGTPFWRRFRDIFSFPFSSGSGWVVMLCFGLAEAVILPSARTPYGAFAWVIFHGLVLSYAGFIVRRVDLGDDELPPPTELQGVWEDGYGPFFGVLLAVLPFLAAVVLAVFVARGEWASALVREPIPASVLCYGLLVLPGALLQQAMGGSAWQIVNPVGHARVLWNAPRPYLAVMAWTVVAIAAYLAIALLLPRHFFLVSIFDGALHVYVALLLGRLYGLFLRELR